VTNPLPPTGAADPESRDAARANAPLTVLTLDRVVSLTDYEDFTRAFAGIAKAQATWLWSGEHRLIHVTAAAELGKALDPSDAVSINLIAALKASGDTHQPFHVDSFAGRTFDVSVRIFVEDGFLSEHVIAAARLALLRAFGFERRALAQSVPSSEVVAVIQSASGVKAVDLITLAFTSDTPTREAVLVAHRARWLGGTLLPAQLLTINPNGINLQVAA
jgi:predicted phage baseplate assembly protein